jgi:hypothetical protein
MNLVPGKVVELDRSSLTSHVEEPGVAVILWRERGNLESHVLDRSVERAAEEYPEVRFASVDIARDEPLAREWAVEEVPTLMIYRDGTLLFTGTGDMPAGSIETLLGSALAMDLGAARKGVNGHHGRFVLGFHTGGGSAVGPWQDNGEEGGAGSDGGQVKRGAG